MRLHTIAVSGAVALVVLAGCGPAAYRSTGDTTTGPIPSDTSVTDAPPSTTSVPTTATPPPTPVSSPIAPAPVTTAPTSAAPTAVVSDVSGQSANFFSPSGNVVCLLSSDAGGASPIARCEIAQHSWTAPPTPASCRLDWGSYFYVDSTARFACVGDTIRGTQPVDPGHPPSWYRPGLDSIITVNRTPGVALGYGRTLTSGALECSSSVQGVTCTNRSTGALLFLSRERYTVH